MRDTTARIVDQLARQIATTLMFGDEAPLADRDAAAGRTFAAAFASQWPRDSAGRSLGQLDLRERVFVLLFRVAEQLVALETGARLALVAIDLGRVLTRMCGLRYSYRIP